MLGVNKRDTASVLFFSQSNSRLMPEYWPNMSHAVAIPENIIPTI